MQEEKVMPEDKIQVLKILSKSIREFKKDSILCPLLVTGEVILECMIPFFTAQLVNRMKENASMQMNPGGDGRTFPSFRPLGGEFCSFRLYRFCPEYPKRYVPKNSGLFFREY